MTSIVAPMCMSCSHYYDDEEDRHRCGAFPEGIPEGIIMSRVDHREPVRGDAGMTFEQNPDMPVPADAFEALDERKGES